MAATCPLNVNVTFYACDFGEYFLGCCLNGSPADTCTHGCPQKDLLPASFEVEYYSYTTRSACTSGDWWSCTSTTPPFLGCCLSNPCQSGCPPSDLRAAIFAPNQTGNPLYSAIFGTTSTGSATALTSASINALPNPIRTAGATHSATTSPSPIRKNSINKFVGGIVGGIVAVAGVLLGLLLLYRRLKSRGHKGSDPPGTNELGCIKENGPRSPTASDIPRRKNETSHDMSRNKPSFLQKRTLSTQARQPMTGAPSIEHETPRKFFSTTSSVPQEDCEEDRTLQELPPNHAPLPEIASSDPPQPCHELPSSKTTIQEHTHPNALQPDRPIVRPHSASSMFPTPQPYGLAFRPHSPSRLSEVSSLDSTPPVARGLSTFSATTSADV